MNLNMSFNSINRMIESRNGIPMVCYLGFYVVFLLRKLKSIFQTQPFQQLSRNTYIISYKWKLKRYVVYPIRYFFDLQKIKIGRFWRKEQPSHNTTENREYREHRVHRGNREYKCDDLVFPAEIWLQIAQYGVDGITLMSVNRSLLDIFGRLVYEEIHGMIVLSSLDKMKLSDRCFLRNGPDFPDSNIDGYDIFVRNQESKNFTREAIDISYNGGTEDYDFSWLQPRYRSERIDMKGNAYVSVDCSQISTIVSSYSGLMCIITEIMKNPKSIMKKYIKKISIDIIVLSEFDEFMKNCFHGINYNNINDSYRYKLIRERISSMMPLFSGYEDYTDERINMRHNMERDMKLPFVGNYRFGRPECNEMTIKSIFDTVYHKELVLVSYVFQSLFFPTRHNNRRNFHERSKVENYATDKGRPSLGSRNHLAIDDLTRQRMNTRNLTDYLASTIRIKRRTFLNGDDLGKLNEFIKEVRTNNNNTNGIKHCFVFYGMNYINNEVIFDQERGRYLSECLAQDNFEMITSTPPSEHFKKYKLNKPLQGIF